MLPELFKLPGFSVAVTSYGLLVATGLLTGTVICARLAQSAGLSPRAVYRLAYVVLPCSLVGTKLFLILAHRDDLGGWHHAFWLAGSRALGGYWGGLLVGIGAAAAAARSMSLPWTGLADASAPALAFGNAVGRIGCLAAGCCWGKPTTSWIGVRFTERAHELTGVPADSLLIPTQLIESLANIVIFVLLLRLWRARRFGGQVMIAYLVMYSVERYLVDFWRDDPRGSVFGISSPQLVSALVLAVGLILYERAKRGHDRQVAQPA